MNIVDYFAASKIDGKEMSVPEFLSAYWTDHVYLLPSDYKTSGWYGVPIANTREDCERILLERYYQRTGVILIREKDFGDVVRHWIDFGIIVSRDEYDAYLSSTFGGALHG